MGRPPRPEARRHPREHNTDQCDPPCTPAPTLPPPPPPSYTPPSREGRGDLSFFQAGAAKKIFSLYPTVVSEKSPSPWALPPNLLSGGVRNPLPPITWIVVGQGNFSLQNKGKKAKKVFLPAFGRGKVVVRTAGSKNPPPPPGQLSDLLSGGGLDPPLCALWLPPLPPAQPPERQGPQSHPPCHRSTTKSLLPFRGRCRLILAVVLGG